MSGGEWSGLVTAVLLLAFLGGVAALWRGNRNQEFDEAARLPLQDDEPAQQRVQP